MPKYEYACKSCGEHIEVVQTFAEATLTECPACGGELRKVFSAPSIAFKGSGFYRTDNRQGRPSTETKSDTKPEKADAPAKPAAKTESSSSSTDSKPTPKASEAKTA